MGGVSGSSVAKKGVWGGRLKHFAPDPGSKGGVGALQRAFRARYVGQELRIREISRSIWPDRASYRAFSWIHPAKVPGLPSAHDVGASVEWISRVFAALSTVP